MNFLTTGVTGAAATAAETDSSRPISSKSSSLSTPFRLAAGAAGASTGHAEVVSALARAGAELVVAGIAGTATSDGANGADLPVPGVPAEVAEPGFPGSPLRSNPRATRNVPLACSILMGLVRTRLAPMRNAFATPA